VEAAERLGDVERGLLVFLRELLEDCDPLRGAPDRAREAPLDRFSHLGVGVQAVRAARVARDEDEVTGIRAPG
jgi:hypothetical protein